MSSDQHLNDEDVELSAEQRQKISTLHASIDSLDFYSLLGVPRTADKKEIKRAYYERTSDFHPDRFFRKRLGSFKPKMEEIFARITEAHDLLCTPERRAEYDSTLPPPKIVASPVPPPMPTPASVPPPHVARTASGVRPAVALTPEDAQARRDALARRLLGGSRPPPKR